MSLPDMFLHGETRTERLSHGIVTWDDREIVAVSKPHITPAEAIEFFFEIDCLLPGGWAEDPKVEMLSDGRVSIRGVGD